MVKITTTVVSKALAHVKKKLAVVLAVISYSYWRSSVSVCLSLIELCGGCILPTYLGDLFFSFFFFKKTKS